ncbi:ATP-grasp domain-containing protein [Halobacteriovorax sp. GFR7]|uniref:ATP-grasp domain-containing protein n=1 Tax=unclassified Halobacteriovorax TaxID=2639665 RepID=UPI003D9931F4
MKSQNLLILTTNPRLYACTQLEAAITEATHSCRYSDPYSVTNQELAWADVVINRNTGLNYNDDDLEKLAILDRQKIINPLTCSRILRDKFEQWLFFKEVLGLSQLIETYSLKKTPTYASKQNKWIIKTTRGQQAKGVYPSTDIINDRKKLIDKGDLNYIIQPYIELKSEWRVLLFKGISSKKVEKLIIRKLPKNSQNDFHILNFASSSCEIIQEDKTPQQVLSIAHTVAESLDFYFISIDILEEQVGGFRLIEVNGCPGMAHSDELLLTSKYQMTMAQLFTKKVINN